MNKDVTELLFNTLSEGAGIQNLIDTAREQIFLNPIMVTNSSFRIVGLSTDTIFDDIVWNEAVNLHGFSKEVIEQFRHDTESDKLFQEHKVFLYSSGLGEKIPRILAPLKTENRTLGYLIIFSVNHPLENRDIENAEILAKALNILMQGSITVADINLDLMDYTLKLLLSELPVESSQIQALTNCDFFMTFSLSLPEKRKEREYLYYLRDQIIQDSSKIHSFPYEENLFVLINYKEEKELDQFFVRLKKLLKEYQIHAGSSNSFEDLTQLKYYFEQAVKVRSFGEKLHPEKKVYSFTEYYVYFFISRIPLELSHTLLCQDYLTLVEYDHVHSLQLVDTITAYFYHSMNINDVSKELHVHRNTISYRLNLIKEKLLIDYTDIRKLRNIVLSHEVKKWNGRLPS